MNLLRSLIIFTLIISTTLVTQAEEKRVLVKNFRSSTLDSNEIKPLTNFFANQLRQFPEYRVISFEEATALADQYGATVTMDCDDDQCLEAIAGAIDAPYIVSGEIDKVGSQYIVNVSMLNVYEATTVEAVSEMASSLDDAIMMLKTIAPRLTGRELTSNTATTVARHEAKELARREAVELARREAEELARREAEELARREAVELARREAEELARRKAEELAKLPKFGMVKIPGGSFMMGASRRDDGEPDERPVHQVSVNGFWIDSTEVTQAEYLRLMGDNPSEFGGSNKPVERVSWWDAIKYCNARSREAGLSPVYNDSTGAVNWSTKGYRLPTEAEWEYAARARTTEKYYWGDTFSGLADYANFADVNTNLSWREARENDGAGEETARVASYRPNSFGLYDMSGNVWEWCNNWYDNGYYENSPSSNPRGASSGSYRVLRGGGWYDEPAKLRSAVRNFRTPDIRLSNLGFRVVLPE